MEVRTMGEGQGPHPAVNSDDGPGVSLAQTDAADSQLERIYELLHEVLDPEVGVNIVDLGLVFGVRFTAGTVRIRMTLTTPGCPLGGYIDESIRQTLTRLPDVDDTEMDLVWEPAWGPHLMTDEAKRQLGWLP
jgi:metal-sulfur cluster biosynthetic enzyme